MSRSWTERLAGEIRSIFTRGGYQLVVCFRDQAQLGVVGARQCLLLYKGAGTDADGDVGLLAAAFRMADAAFARPIGNIVDDAAEALHITVQVTGNFEKAIIPLVTAGQFKAAMEKAQQAKTGYMPPTATK